MLCFLPIGQMKRIGKLPTQTIPLDITQQELLINDVLQRTLLVTADKCMILNSNPFNTVFHTAILDR